MINAILASVARASVVEIASVGLVLRNSSSQENNTKVVISKKEYFMYDIILMNFKVCTERSCGGEI
jgi:hypothetical protein